MALTLEQAIARVPGWRDAHDLKTSPLGGGITNRNFLVETGGEAYVLRIAGENTELLGINRQHEYEANLAAGQLGIGPEVIYFIQPEGYLVTRFVPGAPVPPEKMRQSGYISLVAGTLQKIHNMADIPGEFWVPKIVADYTAIAERHSVAFPENFDWLIERLREAEAALLSTPYHPRPCHNDLLNENFLFAGRLRILDWEYAGMGDAFFDLANFSVNHDFSDEHDRLLLDSYFGEVTAVNWARLKIMRVISDFRESMWGLVQTGISQLDFDFPGYASKHFERLTSNLHDPRWEQWI
ncbi:MAG TPA: choline kinase family protein, partial [Anaerolineales bacterium]|nr:choline kinase family protein [Anaerolineales bacterium]